jgi:hypothetical protein
MMEKNGVPVNRIGLMVLNEQAEFLLKSPAVKKM